jgi:hypothetical protein
MEEVGIYLNNIKQFEELAKSIPSENPNWKKQMIHLSGGNELANTVRSIFDRMSANIQATEYAPEITTYYKNGTVPVDTIFSDNIYDQINQGVSIVSFFGHSAPNTLGFRIDNQSKYANAPLFPLFIALGCSAGNYNISDQSVAEAYCLMENRGFLNLISSTGISKVFDLEFVGQSLYELIGNQGDSLNLGQLLNHTISKTLAKSRSQAGQLSLFGDPAVQLNIPKEKDVTVDVASASTTPDFLGAELDSFSFNFDILSLGKQIDQEVRVKITRQYPGGSLAVLFDDGISLSGYRTSVQIKIDLESKIAAGNNRILISLDEENKLEENLYSYSEQNNEYIFTDGLPGFPIFIPSNNLIPLWPRDKSIIRSGGFGFYASTGDLLSSESEFFFEIDTNILFSSPAYAQFQQSSKGGAIEFRPEYTFENNRVYYWRVSPAIDAQSGNYFWSDHQSFIMLPEKEGWNISHYHQFTDTDKSGLDIEEDHQWYFERNFIPVRFSNGLWESDNQDQLGWFEYNGPSAKSTSIAWEVNREALAVIAFDHRNHRLINHRGGDYGSIAVNKDKDYFAFENTMSGRDSLIYFLENIVPDDFNVLFFTVRNSLDHVINSTEWATDSLRNSGVNIFNLLERFGARDIRNLQQSDRLNYMSHFKKNQGHLFEDLTFDDNAIINREFNLLQWESYGAISLSNSIIRRADRELLNWQYDSQVDSADSYNIYYQLEGNSNKIYTHQNVLSDALNIESLPDTVRQSANFWSDVSDQNVIHPRPAQPGYFRMYGKVIGDFALAPNITWLPPKSEYLAGDQISASVAVINIHHSIDVLPFRITARNLSDNSEIMLANTTLQVSENTSIPIPFIGKISIPGEYRLTIEINPDQDILEANYSNNTLQIPLTILGDESTPTIRVTFDDKVIANNQIVSPTTEISVQLRDENPYILLDEASLLSASIQQPDGSDFEIVLGDNAEIILPISSEANMLELVIHGNFVQEGIYRLTAFGQDKSGNKHSDAYQVNFQVYHEIGFGMRTYPNPVVNQLTIDYILFGEEVNENAEIYISNALGKTMLRGEVALIEGQHKIIIDIPTSWPSGRYQYEVIVRGKNGGEYAEYIDSSMGISAGGRRGQFVVLRAR